MRIFKFLIITTLILFTYFSAQAQNLKNAKKNALLIVEKNKKMLDSINQLLVVFNQPTDGYAAILVAMEKTGNQWKVKYAPMLAGIGSKGFATIGNKLEGDGKTPSGLFLLGQLFCYEKKVNTQLPFIQTTKDDKWIDDTESKDYNKYVRGNTDAKSFEKLLLRGNAYKYCMAIEYNTHPVVKGKGSAIFLHLADKIPSSTAGCVAITEKNMELIISWLQLKQKPSILMGNLEVLKSGL